MLYVVSEDSTAKLERCWCHASAPVTDKSCLLFSSGALPQPVGLCAVLCPAVEHGTLAWPVLHWRQSSSAWAHSRWSKQWTHTMTLATQTQSFKRRTSTIARCHLGKSFTQVVHLHGVTLAVWSDSVEHVSLNQGALWQGWVVATSGWWSRMVQSNPSLAI